MHGNGRNWNLPFLPFGDELLYTDSYPKRPYLQYADIDGDGKQELFGIYRSNQELYLFTLKEHFGHFRLISVVKGTGYQVSYLGTAHITGQKKLNIVVGWKIGGIWSKLSIFEWVNSGLKEKPLNGEYIFSKIEIADMPGIHGKDGKAEIALWFHDTGEAYRVEIYRWEKDILVPAHDVEPYYFKKVVEYYKQKIKEHPEYLFYYPYLKEAEKKASRVLDERAVYLYPASVKEIGGNKWGYINARGKFILPPSFDHAGDFQDNGLAIVRIMDRTGIIDSKGYFIVRPKYDTINPFSEGRASVIDHQGFKVIDESGKEITSKAYSYIGDYKEGRALIADTDANGQYLYGYLNRRGKEVLPLSYVSASDFNKGKAIVKMKNESYALIDLTGKVVKSYSYPTVMNYGEGMLAFQMSKDGKFGYMDEQGNSVIEPQFSEAQPFIGGLAIVNLSDDFRNHYGLIDRNGHFIIKPNYNSLLHLGEGRYAIGKALDPEKPYLGSKYAVADSEGHLLTGFIYNEITKYKEGLASVYNDQATFFIDISGKRMEHLPNVSGRGTLDFDQTVIKGEIDFRLLYFDKNSKLIWQQNAIIPLNNRYSVIEHKFKPNKDYLVYYPQVKGMEHSGSVNRTLMDLSGVKEIPAQAQLESNYMGDFDVTYFKKDLLVIEITGYNYPFGAAHGMPVRKYAHIDLNTGVVYQLKDLFKPRSAFVKVISDIIGDQIKGNEKYSYVFPDTYKGIQEEQPFFISDNAVNIYFAPYEIAPYAAGFPTFTIPIDELTGIINRNGDFWKSFH
ncbi:MAG: WG repeat-containing protein [Neobacillus sp.]